MAERDDSLLDVPFDVIPTDVHFGQVTYQPRATLGPRHQPSLQFFVVHHGVATVQSDDLAIEVAPEHVACLLPETREFFQFDADQTTQHSWATLHFEPMPKALSKVVPRLPRCLSLTRRMADILELALSIQQRRTPGDGAVLLHFGCAFLHAYLAAAAGASTDRPLPAPVWRARRFIEEHFAEPLELADVASAASVTENHIVRLFKQHLHHTPMRYLWRMRVLRGADLLRDTGFSISEIAYRVGFSTPYHFSRLVKQQTGLSPKQLRQSHWGEDT